MGVKENILKMTVFKRRLKLLEEKQKLYSKMVEPEDICKYQLEKFNLMWQKAYTEIPFYKMWKERYDLPESIKSIEELKSFSVLTKKDIQQNSELIFEGLQDYQTISTGGSTAEPRKFPYLKKEMDDIYATNYLARSWWGFEPLDKILLFWGHSHLFGSGGKGKINQYIRVVSDWLINTKRLNAYDMSFDRLGKYVKELNRFEPKFIVGYTSAIYKLSKYIKENDLDINSNNLRGVVVTSETVTKSDIELIEEVFRVPCIIEYGMAEVGIVSYSKETTNSISIMWDSVIMVENNNKVFLTTINDKLFPLINYDTNDFIEIKQEYKNLILQVNKIDGRRNDTLDLNLSGKIVEVHSEIFTHIFKAINGVVDFRILQKKDLQIEIYIDSKNLEKIETEFFRNLSLEYDGFAKEQFEFKYMSHMPLSVAGKTKWISKEI